MNTVPRSTQLVIAEMDRWLERQRRSATWAFCGAVYCHGFVAIDLLNYYGTGEWLYLLAAGALLLIGLLNWRTNFKVRRQFRHLLNCRRHLLALTQARTATARLHHLDQCQGALVAMQ